MNVLALFYEHLFPRELSSGEVKEDNTNANQQIEADEDIKVRAGPDIKLTRYTGLSDRRPGRILTLIFGRISVEHPT